MPRPECPPGHSLPGGRTIPSEDLLRAVALATLSGVLQPTAMLAENQNKVRIADIK